jgi:hypothetical protein
MVPQSAATATYVQQQLERATLLEAALEAAAEPPLLQQLLPPLQQQLVGALALADANVVASAIERLQRLECPFSPYYHRSPKYYEQIIVRVSVARRGTATSRSIYMLCSWSGSFGCKGRRKKAWPAHYNMFLSLSDANVALNKMSREKQASNFHGYHVVSDTTSSRLLMHEAVQDADAALRSSASAQAWLAAHGLASP